MTIGKFDYETFLMMSEDEKVLHLSTFVSDPHIIDKLQDDKILWEKIRKWEEILKHKIALKELNDDNSKDHSS